MDDIGYNDGIKAFDDWYRRLSAAIDQHNKWVADFQAWNLLPDELKHDPPNPVKLPVIRLEGPNYDPKDQTTWPWPKKFFDNTMRKLKDGFDAYNNPSKPDPPKPPDPTPKVVAPRTFNKVLPNGSDARFCITGLPRGTQGLPYDDYTTYDDNGLDRAGGRTPDTQVPGLRQANSMDQYGPCDLYPPLTEWPKQSYDR